MKAVRIIRMIVAALFLAAAIVYFLTTGKLHHDLSITEESQLIPSALASSFAMGALLFWLCATFFIGRLYCSTVCPIGTLSDVSMRLRRELSKIFPRLRRRFSYKPEKRWRYHILVFYLLCLIIGGGLMVVPFVLEPWNIARNVATLHSQEAVSATWISIGIGAGWGLAAGLVLLLTVLIWGFISGRDYCNTVCPIGQALALVDRYSLYHIELDPDRCISCMQCEDGCRSSCIKVSRRIVDNTRCVKCLDCIAVCPTGAMKLQSTRNKPSTPLAVNGEQ